MVEVRSELCLISLGRVNSVEGMVEVRRARATVASSWELNVRVSLLLWRSAELGLVSLLALSRVCAALSGIDDTIAVTREDWYSVGGVETSVMVQSW